MDDGIFWLGPTLSQFHRVHGKGRDYLRDFAVPTKRIIFLSHLVRIL